MSTISESPSSKPSRWPGIVALIIFCLLGMISPVMVLFGAASYNDSYSRDADKTWALWQMFDAGLLFLACVAAILFILRKTEVFWSATKILVLLALLGDGLVIKSGFEMQAAAQHRGGDWGAVGVAASLFFGILIPFGVGLMLLSGAVCLKLSRSPQAAV